MTLAFQADESNRYVDAVLEAHPGDWRGIDRSIDERDEMLQYTTETKGGSRDVGLAHYFLNAFETFDAIRWCAGVHFGNGMAVPAMLDFASGYGRITRLLVHAGIAAELHVSDILPDAMRFQAEHFGVRTIVSAADPAAVVFDREYDFIAVASLFTHLPERTFRAWLERLLGCLTPNGLLLFSVHDESLAGLDLGNSLHFVPLSESRTLDVTEYGSTWVSERYVRTTLGAIDPQLRCARLPRALNGFQDVYVAGRTVDVGAIEQREMLRAYLESCDVSSDTVTFSGWATEVVRPVAHVELQIDGVTAAVVREFSPRPDVAATLRPGTAWPAGWALSVRADAIPSFHASVVMIAVIGHRGARHVVFIGTISDALTARIRSLEATIERMQSSRFWRARQQWFAMKRRLNGGR